MEFDNRMIASLAICSLLAVGIIGIGIYSNSSPKAKSKVKTKAKPKTSASKKPASTTPQKSSDTDDSDVDIGAMSSSMKGYKRTATGKTTTYFNRELSEKEASLIGDITPKRIDVSPSVTPTPSPAPTGSAWNTAGTWEEKNITDWTTKRIKDGIRKISYTSANGEASITSITTVEGESTVGFSRGKKRYIYDMSVDLKWKLNAGGVEVTGDLAVKDISAECCHEFYVTGVTSVSPSSLVSPLVSSHIKSESKGLVALISKELQLVYSDMKTTF